ncbi:ABC transporter ATP-binding protein [Alsobacter soli]|uniref:ABC transporter ATP-binding protein n=1 Tax=Alsobacter soli TaxID=2109933 RepID=A0A2T1HTC7_9HYPH|nr:ATP-binding cassette domain-containing protein [Alsobacter soli]PSC04900.1 ABC transporter ATP-binding protein [Alsobacter soli]
MSNLLELQGVTKNYGAVRALKGIDLTLRAGEVLALIGDNGAGKSTLIKVISGAIVPDGGRMLFEGREVHVRRPEDARALGIETVYQDLALFDNSDIAENLFAGREPVRHILGVPFLRRAEMHAESARILSTLKIHIRSTKALVKELSGGQRQTVAIGRAVAFSQRIVILDEPTAALGVPEQEKVLELVQQLRGGGYSVVLISHNLEHIFRVSDRMHVLRQGETAGVLSRSATTPEEVVQLITGAKRLVH